MSMVIDEATVSACSTLTQQTQGPVGAALPEWLGREAERGIRPGIDVGLLSDHEIGVSNGYLRCRGWRRGFRSHLRECCALVSGA